MQDKLSHTFWKAQHIATVHHHHGNHHAEEEMTKATHEQNHDKSPSTTKTSDPISVHIIEKTPFKIALKTVEKLTFAICVSNVSLITLDKYYPPPKPC